MSNFYFKPKSHVEATKLFLAKLDFPWPVFKGIMHNVESLEIEVVVVVVLLFYVHGKHLRSCRDGQLT